MPTGPPLKGCIGPRTLERLQRTLILSSPVLDAPRCVRSDPQRLLGNGEVQAVEAVQPRRRTCRWCRRNEEARCCSDRRGTAPKPAPVLPTSFRECSQVDPPIAQTHDDVGPVTSRVAAHAENCPTGQRRLQRDWRRAGGATIPQMPDTVT